MIWIFYSLIVVFMFISTMNLHRMHKRVERLENLLAIERLREMSEVKEKLNARLD